MAKIKVTNPKYVIDAHLKTNYFKLRNTGGPKGDKGDTGETGATGPEGPQGATGATGRAATVAIGTTQTLNPGQSAFVNNVGTNNDAIFNFGIPQGEKGDKGDTGATGATGQAATVTVGTTTTLAAGSDATVNNSGSTSAAVLNFGIPKGDKGDTGEKGDTGGVRSEYVTELPASGQENTYYLTGDTATIGTASGESFQVTNNDNTGQVLLTQLNGNATQDGTPTPDAPVAIETVTGGQVVSVVGKNLLSIPTGTHSSSAVTWTITDSTISASGTATATWSELLARQNFAIPLSAGTYTFSIPQALPQRMQLVLYEANNTTHDFNIYEGSTYVTGTTTYTTVAYRIVYRANSSAVSLSFPNELMMEQSATPTTFSPYQAQSYEVNLGKNLLDVSNVNSGSGSNGLTMTANSDGSLTWAGTTTSTWAILTTYTTVNLKAGTYTLSIDKTLAYRFYVEAMLEDNTTQNMIIEAGQTSKTLTFAKNIKQIRLDLANFTNGQAYNETVKAQFEQSASATDFAPYFTPIELAGVGEIQADGLPKYRDSFKHDTETGKWYVEKQVGKVVLDGTEAWTATGGGNGCRIAQSDIILTSANTLAPILSDYFTTATFSSIYNATVDYGIANHNSNHWIVLRDKNWTSASDATTWLSTHNTTVYYALATPTTTEITDETLLSQLNFIANLYGGVNNISIVPSAGAQGTITVKYTTWDKNNRYDVYIWNDTIGDFQIIHSGGGNN